MANPDYVPLVLSVPTSAGGATPAATYSFFTSGYKMPRQGRSTANDVVHNQNGVFKYRYDNGPNVYEWDPFEIIISDRFTDYLGSATQQWSHLQFLWGYKSGPLGLEAPEGVYSVDWANAPLERQFFRYPGSAGDKATDKAQRIVVNFEEG